MILVADLNFTIYFHRRMAGRDRLRVVSTVFVLHPAGIVRAAGDDPVSGTTRTGGAVYRQRHRNQPARKGNYLFISFTRFYSLAYVCLTKFGKS